MHIFDRNYHKKFYSLLVIVFFLGVLVVGLLSYSDYGISWDEPLQRNLGVHTYNFVHHGDRKLLKHTDKYYGQAFEYILVVGEKFLGPSTLVEVYCFRHLANFLFFYISLIFLYKALVLLFKNKLISLFGTAFMLFSPRIFAHSFYNSKDIVFMSSLTISFYFVIRFLGKNSYFNAILAGIFLGGATATRIMGIMFYFLLLGVLGVSILFSDLRSKGKFVSLLRFSSVVTTAFLVTVIVLWPALWNAPISGLREAFETMASYEQKTSTVYFGNGVSSFEVPWHYTLVWLFITTPLLYSFFFVVGGVSEMVKVLKFRSLKESIKPELLYFLGWFFGPLIAVVVYKSTLYNGWRQMFFIYPAFIILGLYGFEYLVKTRFSFIVLFLTLLQLLLIGFYLVKEHPHQYVYFNFFARRYLHAPDNFELDYWGSSTRQAYESLEALFPDTSFKVTSPGLYAKNNEIFFENNAIHGYTKNPSEADFLVTSEHLRNQKKYESYEKVIEIKSSGVVINRVYSLKDCFQTGRGDRT